MMTRRHLFSTLSLATLAVAGPGLLSGCGDETSDPGAKGSTGTGGAGLRLVSSDVQRASIDEAAVADGVAAVQSVLGRLFGELAQQETGNLALSPYSVAAALGMTVAGARGETETQMLEVLGATDSDALGAGLGSLTRTLEALAGPVERFEDDDAVIELASADQLFGRRGVEWGAEFLDDLARDYGAGMRVVDFEHAPEPARAAINAWTADQTQDRITDILPRGSIRADTFLVLVDALYLKAPWDKPFEKALTADGPFHLADGTTVTASMMRASITGQVGGGAGWRSARIPYAGGSLAMTVVLPDPGRQAEVETAFAAQPAGFLTGRSGAVELTMPRWTFRTAVPLKEPLQRSGMAQAFSDAADFSAMTADASLRVDEVYHQVFVAVDEEGTEAAAATAVVMGVSSARPPGEELVLDRPFLFVIHDTAHLTPLFVGRVGNPTA